MTIVDDQKQIRLGMIGCGLISHAHGRAARALSDEVRFVACASRNKERTNEWAREYGCDHAYVNYKDMLAQEKLDGVVIATWPVDHRKHIEDCLDAGVRYILCEKALTISPEDAMAILRKAETMDVIVIEGFMYRHHPVHDRLATLIDKGTIGAVDTINATFHMYDPETTTTEDSDRSWRQKSDAGGGVIHDFLCYPVDAVNRFSGSLPKSVSATGSISPEFGTVNRLFGWVRYENDCVAMIESSRKSVFGQRLVISGAEGELSLDQAWTIAGDTSITHTHSPAFIERSSEVLPIEFFGQNDGRLIDFPVFRRQMENFVSVIKKTAVPKISLTESVINTYTLDALHRSFQENKIIDIELPELMSAETM